VGWLIDPGEQFMVVYWPEPPPIVYDEPTAHLPMPDFAKDFKLTAGAILAG
jgi:Uma2 family endonuclease